MNSFWCEFLRALLIGVAVAFVVQIVVLIVSLFIPSLFRFFVRLFFKVLPRRAGEDLWTFYRHILNQRPGASSRVKLIGTVMDNVSLAKEMFKAAWEREQEYRKREIFSTLKELEDRWRTGDITERELREKAAKLRGGIHRLRDHELKALAYSILGSLYYLTLSHSDGRRLGQKALEIANQLNNDVLRLIASYPAINPLIFQGSITLAEIKLYSMLRLCGEEREKRFETARNCAVWPLTTNPVPSLYRHLGLIHGIKGNFPESHRFFWECIEVAKEIGDPIAEGFCHSYQGFTHTLESAQADPGSADHEAAVRKAMESFKCALQLYTKTRYRVILMVLKGFSGLYYLLAKELDRAKEEFHQMELAAVQTNKFFYPWFLAWEALTLCIQSQRSTPPSQQLVREYSEKLAKAEQEALQLDSSDLYFGVVFQVKAEIKEATATIGEDRREARRYLERSDSILTDIGAKGLTPLSRALRNILRQEKFYRAPL